MQKHILQIDFMISISIANVLLKTGNLSNGTVQNYLGAITNIKKYPISERKLKNVTSGEYEKISVNKILL